MFLGLDLLVGAGVWALLIKVSKEFKEKVENDGYTLKITNKKLSERLLSMLPYLVISIVPVLNLLLLVGGVLYDKEDSEKEIEFDKLEKQLIEEGKLVRKDELDNKILVNAITEEKDKLDELTPTEVNTKTNQATSDYWKMLEERNVPTIQLGNYEDDNEEEKGYQKTLKK